MTQENVMDFKLVWQTDKGGVIFQRQEQPEVMGVKGQCRFLFLNGMLDPRQPQLFYFTWITNTWM